MDNKESLRLDDFRLMCDEVSAFNIDTDAPFIESPNRLIGFEHFVDVFKGLVPLADYDENGEFVQLGDFPEIFSGALPSIQKTGSAVLFTGAAGCGKHTADNTFMSVVYHFVVNEVMDEENIIVVPLPSQMDEAMEFYRIDLHSGFLSGKRKLGQKLDELFGQIYDKAFSHPDTLFYFSFGDVTEILNSKRLAARFSEAVRRLTESPKAFCIFTCIYNGEAAALSDYIKKPFFVLRLAPPSSDERRLYFSYIINRYPNIKLALGAEELAGLTDGFTFAMIKQLVGYLLMKAKSEARRRGLKVEHIRFEAVGESDKIIIDKKTIGTYTDMLKKSIYAEPAVTAVQPVYMPSAPPPQAQPKSKAAEPATAASSDVPAEESKGSFKEKAENMVNKLDTTDQVYAQMDKLIVPSGFHQRILMERRIFSSAMCETIPFTIDGFLDACRSRGAKSLREVRAATISLGGRILVHLRGTSKTPSSPCSPDFDYNIIIRGGELLNSKLGELGKTDEWLRAQLERNGCADVKEVFLAACDDSENLILFKKL